MLVLAAAGVSELVTRRADRSQLRLAQLRTPHLPFCYQAAVLLLFVVLFVVLYCVYLSPISSRHWARIIERMAFWVSCWVKCNCNISSRPSLAPLYSLLAFTCDLMSLHGSVHVKIYSAKGCFYLHCTYNSGAPIVSIKYACFEPSRQLSSEQCGAAIDVYDRHSSKLMSPHQASGIIDIGTIRAVLRVSYRLQFRCK